jgi:hypothetical protein
MMNVADAMSAAERMLRVGRKAALRKPSRATGHLPRPRMGFESRPRSHPDRNSSPETSSAVPAPKNTAAWATPRNPRISCPAAAAAIAIAMRLRRRAARPSSEAVRSSDWLVSRVRGDTRATARSETTTQIRAARMPPTAPAASDAGETCTSSSWVPTAPTHHVFNP